MTESTISSAGLDERRRRALFRSWHRGMREMDFERLMDLPDRDVLMFITGEAPTPTHYDTPVFRKLKTFHTHDGPIFG